MCMLVIAASKNNIIQSISKLCLLKIMKLTSNYILNVLSTKCSMKSLLARLAKGDGHLKAYWDNLWKSRGGIVVN